MKKLYMVLCLGAALFCSIAVPSFAQQNWNAPAGQPNWNGPANRSTKIAIINAKRCLEESKLGKYEQAQFDKMKSQMESVLQEKGRALEDIENKLNDEDYMDSISDEAASELKRKKRAIVKDGTELERQYIQTLQQQNVKIIQKLTTVISKASEQVAQESAQTDQPIDIFLNDEACTYYNPQLDISDRVISKMNLIFDAEQKDSSFKQQR